VYHVWVIGIKQQKRLDGLNSPVIIMSRNRSTDNQSSLLRLRIAQEAARLIARKKVRNFHTARMRAMRWLSKGRLSSADVPTQEEVMKELDALSLSVDWNEQPLSPIEQAADSSNHNVNQSEQWGVMFRPMLEALAGFQWDYETHPEGDALYHSLQVYKLGQEIHPYDEEFLWACLLHDIGFVVDPRIPREAAMRVLQDRVSERIEFLVGELDYAHAYLQGTQLPKWLRREESVDELIDLAKCDRAGRVSGAIVPTLDEAITQLAEMSSAFE